ncbi:hypothetical protein MAR_038182 [Mya arenaria]|uniref:Uncharacterized protein n=1 Tax=Mya arenaria TaxID=6604 RepID=A0ABY7FQL7_MYAAR|nr:hypothetical protein MAR_038182 [Mya arenaria]
MFVPWIKWFSLSICMFSSVIKQTNNFFSMDGAQTNPDFLKSFFENTSTLNEKFSTINIFLTLRSKTNIYKMTNVIKRVRNNLLKSGDKKTCVRNLRYHNCIYWEHWINDFQWDTDTNSFPIHSFKKINAGNGEYLNERLDKTLQTRDDLNLCIIGFIELYHTFLGSARNYIVPSRVNSDVIEKMFCQLQGICNGNNINPTFYQYLKK